MNTAINLITRRHALQTLAAAGIGAALTPRLAAQTAIPAKPTLHIYESYAWLRGA